MTDRELAIRLMLIMVKNNYMPKQSIDLIAAGIKQLHQDFPIPAPPPEPKLYKDILAIIDAPISSRHDPVPMPALLTINENKLKQIKSRIGEFLLDNPGLTEPHDVDGIEVPIDHSS